MPQNLTITIATLNDAAALTAIGIKTFCDTFAKDNTQADMDKYVAEEMNEAKIAAELNDKENTFFLAYDNRLLTGYAKVRSKEIPEELKNTKPLEIERLYVLHEHHGRKTGAALMQHCIDHAISMHCDTIWLGVWEHNHKAINFYTRWGFELFGSHPFLVGDDMQTDVLMKKKI